MLGYYVISEDTVTSIIVKYRFCILAAWIAMDITNAVISVWVENFTSRSFGIYIFHMLWVVLLQFYLYNITENILVLFLMPPAAAFIFTIATVEVTGRIPVLHMLFAQNFIKK